jgi:hypothetical protein
VNRSTQKIKSRKLTVIDFGDRLHLTVLIVVCQCAGQFGAQRTEQLRRICGSKSQAKFSCIVNAVEHRDGHIFNGEDVCLI